MKTVTLCGSMRFSREMMKIAWELETVYHMNVLQCVYNPPVSSVSQQEIEALTAAHYRKIDLSDGIYVVDIEGYIGQSVRQEITYAEKMGKEVIYHSRFFKEA